MTGAALILNIVFFLLGLLAFAQASYVFIVTIAGFFVRRPEKGAAPRTRIAVIIPAHNESLLIERTINSIRESYYPEELFDIIVIADNCTDDTAAIAASNGARSLQRFDEEKKGKGYALQMAFESAVEEKWDYEAYLIIDADSIVSEGLLQKVNDYILSGFHVLNCVNLIEDSSGTQALENVRIAFVLRNMRNAGIAALGGSAPLLGNGMVFSRSIVENYGWSAFSITEDREEWAYLYSKGVKTGYIHEAAVVSDMPDTLKDLENPRSRWDTGIMDIIGLFFFPFLSRLFAEKTPGALVTFMELVTLPFTLLFFIIIISTALTLALHSLVSGYVTLLWGISFFLMALSVIAGLIYMKTPLKSYLNIFVFSIFLMPWRAFNLIRGVLRKRQWRRTTRGDSTGKQPRG